MPANRRIWLDREEVLSRRPPPQPAVSDVSHCYNPYYVPFQQDKEKLVEALLDPSHNTEKVIYFLLLDRKKRRPCYEDETELVLRSRCGPAADPPRKRVDTSRVAVPGEGKNGFTYSQLSQGSPLTARRQLFRWVANGWQCLQGM